MPKSVSATSPKRKPSTLRDDLHRGFKLLKSEKDGRPLEKLIDEAGQQYLARRGYWPLPEHAQK